MKQKAGYFPTLSGYAITERYNDLTDGKRPITAVGNEIFLNPIIIKMLQQ